MGVMVWSNALTGISQAKHRTEQEREADREDEAEALLHQSHVMIISFHLIPSPAASDGDALLSPSIILCSQHQLNTRSTPHPLSQ
jgi:hypothetical protein